MNWVPLEKLNCILQLWLMVWSMVQRVLQGLPCLRLQQGLPSYGVAVGVALISCTASICTNWTTASTTTDKQPNEHLGSRSFLDSMAGIALGQERLVAMQKY